VKCLVLGIRRYDFKDESSGERVEGAKLHYLTLDASEDAYPDPDRHGEIPFEVPVPQAMFDDFASSPAFFDVEFRQRAGRGGRPSLQVSGVSYMGPANFEGAHAARLDKKA
jgi:hypothetical protein